MPHSEPTEPTPAEPQKFYLTTPIYYVNARPHIGHAYTTVVADVLARRHRLLGHPTFFLTGTDEHGQKIERSAAAAGIPPQQFADGVSAQFRALWDRMGLTYDRYIRTTDPDHLRGAQVLFAELFRLGHIYLASYTGSYCVSDEAFVDLPAGTPCPDCGRPLETVTEENFFFRLSNFQLPLLNLIESDTLKITPEASRNEVLSFLRGDLRSLVVDSVNKELIEQPSHGLLDLGPPLTTGVPFTVGSPLTDEKMEQILDKAVKAREARKTSLGHFYVPGALKDLSISRSSFTWGIPVPEPAASLTKEPHVIYVWLDALANYMTAIGYGNPDPAAQIEFHKWWPANLHLVGKEITRFHCIYWPAFLLALNPATATTSASEAVILSEAKDPRISSSLQTTPEPEGAPSMTQSGMGEERTHFNSHCLGHTRSRVEPRRTRPPPRTATPNYPPSPGCPIHGAKQHEWKRKTPTSRAVPRRPRRLGQTAGSPNKSLPTAGSCSTTPKCRNPKETSSAPKPSSTPSAPFVPPNPFP